MKKLATISVLVACLLATSFTPALAENENDILFGKNYPFGKSNLLANSTMLSNSNSSEDSYSIMKPKRRKSSKRKGRRGGRGGSDIAFSKGNVAIDLGAGLSFQNLVPGFTSSLPPLSISGEYCIWSGEKGSLGVGAYFGYTGFEYSPTDMLNGFAGEEAVPDSLKTVITYNQMVYAARISYHYNFNSRIEWYISLLGGYSSISYKTKGPEPLLGFNLLGSMPYVSSLTGFKFYFTDNIGMFIEAGYGVGFLNAGISAKF